MSYQSRIGAAAAALTVAAAAPAIADSVDGRLDGQFRMHGRITKATHVRGEHQGQTVKRNWRFTPKCDAGPCDTVVLHRHRGAKRIDRVVLHRDAAGEYSGKAKFHFPIRCAGIVHKHGGEARFEIFVKVTNAKTVGDELTATAIKARYVNTKRINHTQCHGSLGRDGARYTGKLQS